MSHPGLEWSRRRRASPNIARACPQYRGQPDCQPTMQLRHDRTTVLLMKLQSSFALESSFVHICFKAIHSSQRLENITAFGRKALHDIYKLPSSVSKTVRNHNLRRSVSGHCAITHHTSEWVLATPPHFAFKTSARFSPARWQPVKYSAIFRLMSVFCQSHCPSLVAKMPLVNTPVRLSDGSRTSRSTRMLVSSLCSTSPCAACRISSSRAGLLNAAASSTISHWVAAGSGIPRLACRFARR
jgi:hypothetical protein